MGPECPELTICDPWRPMQVCLKPMTKGGLARALSEATEIRKSARAKAVTTLAEIAAKEVKRAGKFVPPSLCMVKTRLKPATKAGKREVFGKVVMVKAKPARTVKGVPRFGIEEERLSCRIVNSAQV